MPGQLGQEPLRLVQGRAGAGVLSASQRMDGLEAPLTRRYPATA